MVDDVVAVAGVERREVLLGEPSQVRQVADERLVPVRPHLGDRGGGQEVVADERQRRRLLDEQRVRLAVPGAVEHAQVAAARAHEPTVREPHVGAAVLGGALEPPPVAALLAAQPLRSAVLGEEAAEERLLGGDALAEPLEVARKVLVRGDSSARPRGS